MNTPRSRVQVIMVFNILFVCTFLGQGAKNEDQLKLAFTWNRSDIAEEKIFVKSYEWAPGEL